MKKRIVILASFLLIANCFALGMKDFGFGIKPKQGPSVAPKALPVGAPSKPTYSPAPVTQPSLLSRSNAMKKTTTPPPSPTLTRSNAIKINPAKPAPVSQLPKRPEFTNPLYDPKAPIPLKWSTENRLPVTQSAPIYSAPQKPVAPALLPKLSQTPPVVNRSIKPTSQNLPPALPPKPSGAPVVDRTNKPGTVANEPIFGSVQKSGGTISIKYDSSSPKATPPAPIKVVKGNATSGSSARGSSEA
jgi:hypothetical protein